MFISQSKNQIEFVFFTFWWIVSFFTVTVNRLKSHLIRAAVDGIRIRNVVSLNFNFIVNYAVVSCLVFN